MKSVIRYIFFFLLVCTSFESLGQQTQIIQGILIDKESEYPIIGASVILKEHDPIIGTTTDPNGRFKLENVPTGRHQILISAIGYETITLNEILVIGGKSTQLDLKMTEKATQLDEVVVKPDDPHYTPNNEMALVSARGFDTELTERFAGSRNDPARMATNFAGVSGANDGRNDIIIRGNSPMGVLWRLEGVDIPSPNHFAAFGSTGGPVSMLNTNTLGQSDFMTAAFPSAYGNALAGVFDLNMRNGNLGKNEFMGQIGFNGIELGAEGPMGKNSNSSYLINYRYSTLAFFKLIGISTGTGEAVPEYQDLSMKLNFALKDASSISIFAIAGNSNIDILGSELDLDDPETDLYGNEMVDIYNRSRTAITGVSHNYFFNKNTYGKLILAYTHARVQNQIDSITWNENIPTPTEEINSFNKEDRITAHYFINKKWNKKHTTRTGLLTTSTFADFTDSTYINHADQWHTFRAGDGRSQMTQIYTDWMYKFHSKWLLRTGLYTNYYQLNDNWNIEPRINLQYKWNHNLSLSAGFGIHSQQQPLPILLSLPEFGQNNSLNSNQNLDASRSRHYVLGMEYLFAKHWRLKSEIYYQDLYNIPVDPFPSSFSMLNAGADFSLPYKTGLVNEGIGRNYGVELTLERNFSDGFYMLMTSSIFDSQYQGSDGVWRNTAFNSEYVANLLLGKEWKLNNSMTLMADTKVVTAGGRYYTPIDFEESIATGEEILDESKAFSEKMDAYFRWDIKVGFRWNLKKITQEWTVDIQNLTNRLNPYDYNYNPRTQSINQVNQLGLFVVPQYRIYF
ncbi:TonB-dependent receptor [Sediminitomix flava]|uniref:Outer membrane receptor protein involved in Fe transport n=1 Tax=Sediminitomix flava TaxID=379075 RepID=A0A315Z808_SEDFL|nr:TonB-dependent receptor [Sediminitomix flava]PWJ40055.1 outer membrane receptor protein involved in Fe transport [Sediminitomix flava]